MLTSTSLNPAFIAKLVHAANVAIATERYCEVRTSKGAPSVLVEFVPNGMSSSLRFTHISGQDVTALVWDAICGYVVLPMVVPAYVEHEQADSVEAHDGYQFLSFYLLACLLILASVLGMLSWGSAVVLGGFVVVIARLVPYVSSYVLSLWDRSPVSAIDRVEPSIC